MASIRASSVASISTEGAEIELRMARPSLRVQLIEKGYPIGIDYEAPSTNVCDAESNTSRANASPTTYSGNIHTLTLSQLRDRLPAGLIRGCEHDSLPQAE